MPKIPATDNFIVDLRESNKQKNNNDHNVLNTKHRLSITGVWDFVRYNNAFLILLIIGIMAFSGLVFASEDVRDSTIGGKKTYAEGVDNTILLETDLDSFSMDFTITGIFEDEEKFLVSYSYIDLDIVDAMSSPIESGAAGQRNSWQYIEKTATRKIAKPFRKDLGLYLAEQLSQESNARLKELKTEQKKAQETGQTKVVQVTEYSGLIGKVLNLSASVFPGYDPIKKIELKTPEPNEHVQERASRNTSDNLTDVYQTWVNANPELMADLNGEDSEDIIEPTDEAQTDVEGEDEQMNETSDSIDAGAVLGNNTNNNTQEAEDDNFASDQGDVPVAESADEETSSPQVNSEAAADTVQHLAE